MVISHTNSRLFTGNQFVLKIEIVRKRHGRMSAGWTPGLTVNVSESRMTKRPLLPKETSTSISILGDISFSGTQFVYCMLSHVVALFLWNAVPYKHKI